MEGEPCLRLRGLKDAVCGSCRYWKQCKSNQQSGQLKLEGKGHAARSVRRQEKKQEPPNGEEKQQQDQQQQQGQQQQEQEAQQQEQEAQQQQEPAFYDTKCSDCASDHKFALPKTTTPLLFDDVKGDVTFVATAAGGEDEAGRKQDVADLKRSLKRIKGRLQGRFFMDQIEAMYEQLLREPPGGLHAWAFQNEQHNLKSLFVESYEKGLFLEEAYDTHSYVESVGGFVGKASVAAAEEAARAAASEEGRRARGALEENLKALREKYADAREREWELEIKEVVAALAGKMPGRGAMGTHAGPNVVRVLPRAAPALTPQQVARLLLGPAEAERLRHLFYSINYQHRRIPLHKDQGAHAEGHGSRLVTICLGRSGTIILHSPRTHRSYSFVVDHGDVWSFGEDLVCVESGEKLQWAWLHGVDIDHTGLERFHAPGVCGSCRISVNYRFVAHDSRQPQLTQQEMMAAKEGQGVGVEEEQQGQQQGGKGRGRKRSKDQGAGDVGSGASGKAGGGGGQGGAAGSGEGGGGSGKRARRAGAGAGSR